MKLERIIVGVDGSANGHAAAEYAAGLAAIAGAEVVAVHAAGLLDQLDDGESVPTEAHRAEIVDRFERVWCAPLDDAGVSSRRYVRDGTPVTVLLAVAEEEDADLVVVGSRGVGANPDLLLGSTSTYVAQHSTRPVVIIPHSRVA